MRCGLAGLYRGTRTAWGFIAAAAIFPIASLAISTYLANDPNRVLECSSDVKKDATYYLWLTAYFAPLVSAALVATALFVSPPRTADGVWRYVAPVLCGFFAFVLVSLVSIPVFFVQSTMQYCWE